MVATIFQIIGKINPELYASNGKELLKKYKNINDIPAEEVKPQALMISESKDSFKIDPKNGLESAHTLTYESYTETLEPVYYFVLDLMEDFGLKPEKLIDNFSPSPGSTQFGEMGVKKSTMQQHATRVLGDVNTVLRSVLNVLYDLRDFKLRLQDYDNLSSKDKAIKNAAVLALKQLWMDKVDINKGNSSIKALAIQGGMPQLLNAFLATKEVHDVTKPVDEGGLDLNDITKRIIIPRIQEFQQWTVQSEQELRKRYQLERTYLRSQANSLKLYSRWAKPYLLASQQLETKFSKNAALVKTFNRTILELTLLGKSPLGVKESALEGSLPKDFKNENFIKKLKKGYNSCVLIDFVFRAVPQQNNFLGKVDVTFKGYALTDDELAKLKQEMDKSEMGDVLRLIEGTTDDSIDQLQEEINFFLEDKDEFKIKEDEAAENDVNPFLALLGMGGKKKEEKPKEVSKEKEPEIIVKKDDWIESTHLRPLSASKAATTAFTLFDIYKKAHGMSSYT